LHEPLRQLGANAGLEGSVVVDASATRNARIGRFDVRSESYVMYD
jgi:hypothetical protein